MKSAHDLVEQARSQITEITPANAPAAINEADVLIDVREADEYRAGHIGGALNIPRGLLEFRLAAMPEFNPRDTRIVLYCKTSGRAALAAASLKEMGYFAVCSIAGGFDAWVENGLPVVHPQMPSFD